MGATAVSALRYMRFKAMSAIVTLTGRRVSYHQTQDLFVSSRDIIKNRILISLQYGIIDFVICTSYLLTRIANILHRHRISLG